jgi:hypothetical protein
MWILWIPVAIILRINVSLQVKPHFIRKECQLLIDITFNNRLQKPTAKMNPASWTARLQGVVYCCYIGYNIEQMCCRSCTRLWHSSLLNCTFQWFSRYMFKSGPSIIYFSSVSTLQICKHLFIFIPAKTQVSLFMSFIIFTCSLVMQIAKPYCFVLIIVTGLSLCLF